MSDKVNNLITTVDIERFKSVAQLPLTMERVTVLVGTNNSGKSSVLQAMHFAVSLCQSRKLIGSSNFNFTIAPQQILYTPVADVSSLSPSRNLTQDKAKEISVRFSTETGKQATVGVRRGKNRNLNVQIAGDAELIAQLEDLNKPFSMYVPGLAGLAKTELLVSRGVLTRATARGDANLVLRNVLRELQKDIASWAQFNDALEQVFPDVRIDISFDEHTDEFIDVEVALSGYKLPIDAAGTGFLQTTQILSYIFLFRPSLILLDEPDSHLHPNNQRALARLLLELSGEKGTQVLLATHSRHILDAVRDEASIVWLKHGTIVPTPTHIGVLMDLGALDSAEGLLSKGVKYVILTEDTDKKAIKAVLNEVIPEPDYQVWSYKGCGNTVTAAALAAFVQEVSTSTRIVLHRDSDYLEDDQLASLRENYQAHSIHPWFTPSVDIEAVFCSVEHLKSTNPEHADTMGELYEDAITEAEPIIREHALRGALENYNVRSRHKLSTRGEQELREWAATFPITEVRWMKGKVILPILRRKYQEKYKANITTFADSTHLALGTLREALGVNESGTPDTERPEDHP